MATVILTVIKYWPTVVAVLYLLYVLAAGKTDQVPAALTALLATFGLNAGHVGARNVAEAAYKANMPKACRPLPDFTPQFDRFEK